MGTVIFVCIGIVLLGLAIYYIGAALLGFALIGLVIWFPFWIIDGGYVVIMRIIGYAILAFFALMVYIVVRHIAIKVKNHSNTKSEK